MLCCRNPFSYSGSVNWIQSPKFDRKKYVTKFDRRERSTCGAVHRGLLGESRMGTDRVIRSRIPTVSDGINDSSDAAGGIPVGLSDSRVGQTVVDPHGVSDIPVPSGALGGTDRTRDCSSGAFCLGLLFLGRVDGMLPVVAHCQIFARRELSGSGIGGLFPGLFIFLTDCDDRVSGVGEFVLVPLGRFAISPN